MLGKIKTISKSGAVVQLDASTAQAKDLINLHVVFEDENKKILGEIESILEDTINYNSEILRQLKKRISTKNK